MNRLAIALFCVFVSSSAAFAAPTAFIYRGRVVRDDGTAVTSPTVPVAIRLYAAEFDTAALWSGMTNAVLAADGGFQIAVSDALPPVDPPAAEGPARPPLAALLAAGRVSHVGITFDKDRETYPRQAFTTFPCVAEATCAERGGHDATVAAAVSAARLTLAGDLTADRVSADRVSGLGTNSNVSVEGIVWRTLDARHASSVRLLARNPGDVLTREEKCWTTGRNYFPTNSPIVRMSGDWDGRRYVFHGDNYPSVRRGGLLVVVEAWDDAEAPCMTFVVGPGENFELPYDIETRPGFSTFFHFFPFAKSEEGR